MCENSVKSRENTCENAHACIIFLREDNIDMETFDLKLLCPGEILSVRTETGSTYHLLAETAPESLSEAGILFKGFRATRNSDHDIAGRPEKINNEPALLITHSGESNGVLRTGDCMELVWDRDHPESRKSWDIQFGPKFNPLTTSRIVDIKLVPVSEN